MSSEDDNVIHVPSNLSSYGVNVAPDTDSDSDADNGPTFLLSLDRYKVKAARVIIRAPFVRENNLTNYADYTINFPKRDYIKDFKLVTHYDPRRETVPPSHVVIKGDWKDFRSFNHLRYGCVLLFQLNPEPNGSGGRKVVFTVAKI